MASSELPWQGAGVGYQALPDDEIADDDQDGAEGDVSENEQQVPEQSSPIIIHCQPSGTILRGAPAINSWRCGKVPLVCPDRKPTRRSKRSWTMDADALIERNRTLVAQAAEARRATRQAAATAQHALRMVAHHRAERERRNAIRHRAVKSPNDAKET